MANPDLAAIYTANDDVALGAMQAVNAANRKGKTLVTGMNGVPLERMTSAIASSGFDTTGVINSVGAPPASEMWCRTMIMPL